jgi:hypothetical protein
MQIVSVLYPRASGDDGLNRDHGSRFNLDHYIDVHLKLGFGLMRKHFGTAPERAIVLHTTSGMDGSAVLSRYLAVCFVVFKSREDAALFAKVFAIDEAAKALQADWANYCPAAPEIVVGAGLELSGAEILEGADDVLAARGISPTRT